MERKNSENKWKKEKEYSFLSVLHFGTISSSDNQRISETVVGMRIERGQRQNATEADGQRKAHVGGSGTPSLFLGRGVALKCFRVGGRVWQQITVKT